MAEPNTMYRALRQKTHSHLPQTAPIAAKFEDCRQCFHRLCPALKCSSLQHCSSLADDSYGKFLAWGEDSGASARSLDRSLRKTSSLASMTLELLMDLYSTLQKAFEIAQDAPSSPDYFEDDELRIDSDEGTPEEINLELKEEVPLLIENVDGIIGCLVRLLPNLRDPFPLDTYSSASTPSDAYPDIDLAATLFPTASHSLLSRLGRANWRRRTYLKTLQEKRPPGMPYRIKRTGAVKQARKFPQREVAIDAFNFQRPSLKVNTSPPHSQKFWPASESTAPSVDDGVSVSVFSKSVRRTEGTVTSVAPSDVFDKRPTVQTVPRPPIPLEDGGAFLCPYCHDEIDIGIQVVSNDDWEGHVFNDLEPYMCTFDDCLRAEKTYGLRDDWFKHELESHRVVKVWACQSCQIEYRSAQEFEAHLQEKHDSICGPQQMAMMVSLCMKHSQRHQGQEHCPLCSVKMKSVELKAHVANHLEQLALTSVNGDDSSEEDDLDILGSQRWDDTMSEGRTKLEILNDFVEEQLGYVIPEKRGPADKGLEESNLDFLNDSDEEESDDDGRPGLSSWKLANFLGAQPGPRNFRLRVPGSNSDIPEAHRSESNNGSLSAIRTGTHPRDENFVGRDADLANLYKILSVSGRLCVLSGTGGIGKTSTALEYSFRHEQSYSCVFWVQSETQVGCADTFSLIATQLQLDNEGSIIDQKQLIEISRDFLEKTDKRWLLVFDNVDKWTDVEEYIPVNMAESTGSILITTRIRELGPPTIPSNFFHIDMKEMTMDESRRLLIQRMQPNLKFEKMRLHPEWRTAGVIASLAGLPLAMSQIAGYVIRSNITLAEFLELWNEWRGNNPVVVFPAEASAPSYTALETIWSIALSELSAEAYKLLRIMAFLDSDVIQRELLLNDHKSSSLAFLHSKSAMRYRRMIDDLGGRKLISIKKQDGKESYSVHRLLQHRLLQDLEGADRETIFNMTFELVRDRLPRPSIDTPDSNKWNVFKEYLPHVLSLQRIFDDTLPIMTPFVGLSELFRDGGVHLWQRGLIPDGLRLLNSAEAILDKLECDEDQLRADINIATALLIQYFGISFRAESRQRFAKILEIRRKFEANAAPGTFTMDDELRLCNANADYGNALLQFNNYKEAEQIYQQCHDKYRQWGTEDDIPLEYGKFNHHMAFCRMYDKDFKTAIKLSAKAFELVTRGQSDHIQLILRFRFDLACIILQSGDIERSLKIQEQILKARLSLQGNGKATYFTLQSYYAVGALYAYLGKLDEAEHYMRTALNRAQERAGKGFWPDAAVARTEYHLSQVLKQNGKDGPEASTLAAKARTVLSRLLPYDPLNGVAEEDELALYDHLQPVFGGRFTGTSLLKYVL